MGLQYQTLLKGILILFSSYAPVIPNLYEKMRCSEECLHCFCLNNENGWGLGAVELQKAP